MNQEDEFRSHPIPENALNDKPQNPILDVVAEGGVLFYGRHEPGDCWVFSGIVNEGLFDHEWETTSIFERGALTATVDVVGRNLGSEGSGLHTFIFLVRSSERRLGRLQRIEVKYRNTAQVTLIAAINSEEISADLLLQRSEGVVAGCEKTDALNSITETLSQRLIGEAYVELYGYCNIAAGWLLNGWLSSEWIDAASSDVTISLILPSGSVSGNVVLSYYFRDDLNDRGMGFVMHLASDTELSGRLYSLTVKSLTSVVTARPSLTAERLSEPMLVDTFLDLIGKCESSASQAQLLRLLAAPARSTGDERPEQSISFEVDAAYDCRPDSILLVGWTLFRAGTLNRITLVSHGGQSDISIQKHIWWLDRADVVRDLGTSMGLTDPKCGFVIRARLASQMEPPYQVELETSLGSVERRPVHLLRLPSLESLRSILSNITPTVGALDELFDEIIGPPLKAFNDQILRKPLKIDSLTIGGSIEEPVVTLVITLYGRIDFIEFQMAAFTNTPIGCLAEIIYIVDDPSVEREARLLAFSVYERFRISFKIFTVSRNLGFAPANNLGWRNSKGRYVCFMNSDVIPATANWLEALIAELERDETLGMVGPLLLFEDGSVQHDGIMFDQSPTSGGWYFPKHARKGLKPKRANGLNYCVAITGACIVMRRADVQRMEGFSEDYVIGDFEDTDLCLRLSSVGLRCAISRDVKMYHLERRSQAVSSNLWRSNLTLYNAWIHQRRWMRFIQQANSSI